MPKEKEAIKIDATPNGDDRSVPFLIYAQVEFEVKALDHDDAEAAARKALDEIANGNRDKYLRIVEAKVADKNTGYFFKK